MSRPAGPVSVSAVLDDVRTFLDGLKREMPEVFRPRARAPVAATPLPSPPPTGGREIESAPSPRSPGRGKGEGPTLPFRGGRLEARLVMHGGRFSAVQEEDGGVCLRLAEDESTAPHEFLREWYLRKAWEALAAAVGRWSGAMGLKPGVLRVKDQRTLWGSCSRDGNLSFNWRLVLAPPPVLDYVVIHELAHLRELNHSRRFWQVVARWCPDYDGRRRWLRDHERELRWEPREAAFG